MKLKFMFVLATVLLCLTSCGPKETEVTGEAFVVTQGAGSYKLGLVQVSVIAEKDIIPYVQKMANDQEVAQLKQEWDKAKTEFFNASDHASDLETSLEQDKASVDSDLNSASSDFDSTGRKLDTWRWHLNQFHSAADSITQALNKAAVALTKLNDAAGAERYFASLPTAVLTTTTDSDGKFTLKLPIKGRFAIAASATRKVAGNNDETYYWLIWVDSDGSPKHIMLSNNNLTDSGAAESVIKTTTYKAED